jgi:hypothetical protein
VTDFNSTVFDALGAAALIGYLGFLGGYLGAVVRMVFAPSTAPDPLSGACAFVFSAVAGPIVFSRRGSIVTLSRTASGTAFLPSGETTEGIRRTVTMRGQTNGK